MIRFSIGNAYYQDHYRYVSKNNDPSSMKAEVPSTHELTTEKATVFPKRHMQMTPQTQQMINRPSPSRNSPVVGRKLSATAQSVLGGVKNLLMPVPKSTMNNNINNNNVDTAARSGIHYTFIQI